MENTASTLDVLMTAFIAILRNTDHGYIDVPRTALVEGIGAGQFYISEIESKDILRIGWVDMEDEEAE